MTENKTGTAIEPVSASLIEEVNKAVKWDQLAKLLAPREQVEVKTYKVPLPAVITTDQREALAKLDEVFGKVVPTERRELEPVELTSLMKERTILDSIEKMAAKRKEDIRTTVLNHIDQSLDNLCPRDFLEGIPKDKDGHYIVDQEVPVEDSAKSFVWSKRGGSPNLSPSALELLAEDPDSGFTHQDYLEMTRPSRVFDEAKAMAHIRKHPELLPLLAKHATMSKSVGVFTLGVNK